MLILAGDVGGTKTKLAYFCHKNGTLASAAEALYESREYKRFDDVIHDFISRHEFETSHVCFGVAGPVRHGVCRTSNLPWVNDAKALATTLGLPKVELINDLEATAYGVKLVPSDEIVSLATGSRDAYGSLAVIAAGKRRSGSDPNTNSKQQQ